MLPSHLALAWHDLGETIWHKMMAEGVERAEYYRLSGQFRAVSDQWLEEFADRPAKPYRMAFDAVVEHGTRKQIETLRAVTVSSERNGIVFGLAPSCTEPGHDYKCTLNVGTRVHSCECRGHASHGHCWHSDWLMERYPEPQLITVEMMLENAFAACDDLDGELIGYESENRKSLRHEPQISPEAMARAQAPSTIDYCALFEEG